MSNRGKTNPNYKSESVEYIRMHMDTETDEVMAAKMKELGIYSAKTYIGDIVRSVKKIIEKHGWRK